MAEPFATVINPVPTEVRAIKSTYVDQEYRLFISLPVSYTPSDKTYPVLYLLDGNGVFSLIRQIIELLQVIEAVPELVIVGVGYPKDTYLETATLRGRDLTYKELSQEAKVADDYPFDETGGGVKFLNFIAHELIPFIDQRYRTDPDNRTLLGWSLAASFALNALFQVPRLFKSVIAISPPLDEMPFDSEAQYAKENAPLPVRLFVAQEIPADVSSEMQRRIEIKRQFIYDIQQRKYAGLQVTWRQYEGEDHFGVGPIASLHALREIYR